MAESSSESQELAERLLKFHMNEIQQLLEEKQASFKKVIAEYRDLANRSSVSERLNNLKNQINSQLSYLKILDSIDSTLKIQAVCEQFFASRQIQNYSKVRITILDEDDEPNQDQHHSISNSNNNCTTAEYEGEQEQINYVDEDFDDENNSINDSESSISYIPSAIDISSSSIRCPSEQSSRASRRNQPAQRSPHQQPNIAFKKDIFQRLIVPNVSQEESEEEQETRKKAQTNMLPQSKGIKKQKQQQQQQQQMTSSHSHRHNHQPSPNKPKTKKTHPKKTYFKQSVKQEVEDFQPSNHSVNSTVTDKVNEQKKKTFTEYLKHMKNTAKMLNLEIPKIFLDKRFYEKRCNGLRSVGTMLNDLDKIFVAKLFKALSGDVESVEDLVFLPAELITGLAAQVEKRRLLDSEEEESDAKEKKNNNTNHHHIQNNNRKEHANGTLHQSQKRKIISSDEGERDEDEEDDESSSDIEDNDSDDDDSIFFDSYSREYTDKEDSQISEIDMVPEILESTQKSSVNLNSETRANRENNINGNIQIASATESNNCLNDKQQDINVPSTDLNKDMSDLPVSEDLNSMKGQEENQEMNTQKPPEMENRIKDENGVQGNKNKECIDRTENGQMNQEDGNQKNQENMEQEELLEQKEKDDNGINMKWLNENTGGIDKALAFDEEKEIVEEKEVVPEIEQDKLLENRGIVLGFKTDFNNEEQIQEPQQQEEEEALKQGLQLS